MSGTAEDFPLDSEELDHGEEGETFEDDAQEGHEGAGQGHEEGQGTQPRQEDGNEHREGLNRPAWRENDGPRSLRERAQIAEAAALAAQQALREFQARQEAQPDPAQQALLMQQEQERLQSMLPHEQAQYYAQRNQQMLQQQLAQMQRQTADTLDRLQFQALTAANPAAARHAAKVEQMVAEYAAKGTIIPREAALRYVIGDAVLSRAPQAAARARQGAQARVSQNTVTRGGAGGDVAPERRAGRGNDLAAVEARLKGKFI